MTLLTDSERKLLERLAAEGKATRLALGEKEAAKSLEGDGFVFMVSGTAAIITPKGRRLLAGEEKKPKRGKPPSSLLE